MLGGNGLGLGFNKSKVTLSLFLEKEIPPGNTFVDGACVIVNGGERPFNINRGNNACQAQFHSIQLKNVKRKDRGKNEELVTEHKYAFVFYTSVNILGEDIPLRVLHVFDQFSIDSPSFFFNSILIFFYLNF